MAILNLKAWQDSTRTATMATFNLKGGIWTATMAILNLKAWQDSTRTATMATFNLKAWQGSAWTSLPLSYHGTRKVRLETFSCYGAKKITFWID